MKTPINIYNLSRADSIVFMAHIWNVPESSLFRCMDRILIRNAFFNNRILLNIDGVESRDLTAFKLWMNTSIDNGTHAGVNWLEWFDSSESITDISRAMSNESIIQIETINHFNEIVIDDSGKCVRLIGCAEGIDDYYWMYVGMGPRKFSYSSCVGRFFCLTGRLPTSEYDSIDRLFEMNGAGAADVPTLWKMIS